MSVTCDVRTLAPISRSSVKLTERGEMWHDLAMYGKQDAMFPGNRLLAHYGNRGSIPEPTVVVEEAELRLWFYWEIDGKLIIIVFDYELDWNFA